MNIMFEESITEEARQKYILLELDTFYFENSKKTSTAYCLVEQAPIQEMIILDQFVNLHDNLIKNYKLQNWKFCEDALEHLVGKWGGELDTFYENIISRINEFKVTVLSPEWNAVIHRP